MRLSEMIPAEDVLARNLTGSEFKAEYDRTAFAHQVALALLKYRTEHELTQAQLAQQVGTTQSVIARLETGERAPSLATLAKLSRGLGITFHVDISPSHVSLVA